MAMRDSVEQLRSVIGVDTDLALAAELGVERSTIAQWRRRGSLPKVYQAILDTEGAQDILDGTHARRRTIYGDGAGGFMLRAALSVIPTSAFDYPGLSAGNLGRYRERLILGIVPVIQRVCETELGIARVSTEPEFENLLKALERPAHQELIQRAIATTSM